MTGIEQIQVAQVVAGDNDRQTFDQVALQELADSMKTHGLAQPITVRPIWLCTTCGHRDADNPLACERCSGDSLEQRFEIVAGERRYRAALLLGWQTIPAIVREGMSDEAASAVMLAENVARADLDPIDEGRAYQVRMEQYGWTVEQVARFAGVSTVRVQFRLKLLRLRSEIQHLVRSGNLSIGYAQVLSDGELDLNRQMLAITRLHANPTPTPTWFRREVNRLLEEQAQESLFDLSLLTVQEVEQDASEFIEPPSPSTTEAPKVGKTLIQIVAGQVKFWNRAAEAWNDLGKPFKRQECQAAALVLQALL